MLLNAWGPLNTWLLEEVAEEQNSGGYEYWIRYEQEYYRRREEEKKRRRALKKARKIKEKLDRELAIAEREIEAEDARKAELTRLLRLTQGFKNQLALTDNAIMALEDATKRQTFSAMERLEREMSRLREEEEFMMMAVQILVNQ